MYCYWPSCSLGVKNKVKRGALPDKEKWLKYPIRVFVYLGMFYLLVTQVSPKCNSSIIIIDLQDLLFTCEKIRIINVAGIRVVAWKILIWFSECCSFSVVFYVQIEAKSHCNIYQIVMKKR